MPDLPEATVQIDEQAGALAAGTEVLTVLACVELNDDITPRVFSSSKAMLEQHGYTPAIDYCASHFKESKKPVILVPLPKAVAGTIGRIDTSGNTGSCVISAAAGSNGVLEALDIRVTPVNSGTTGTDQMLLDLSCDGGRVTKRIRLGTALTYTIPYVGVVLNFTVGTLAAGDLAYKATTTAPRWDQAGLAAARVALTATQKQSRSWLVDGDLVDSDDADDVLAEINGYATENSRCSLARTQIRDRKVQAALSRTSVRMSGSPTITFAEVGATADTITRSVGSFVTDGFAVGMAITVTGSTLNNFANQKITAVSASVLTLDTQDLVAEGPASGVVIVGSHSILFAEVGATADTITRSGGSWLDDGFAAGDRITITGTASNNITSALLVTVTATVLTLDTQDLAPEFIGSSIVVATAGETDATWVAAMDSEFGPVASQNRIDLGGGRARKLSVITGWRFRRPFAWAASIREYQHDVQIPTYRKEDGPLDGWSLLDESENTVEHDERINGGLLLAGISCFRSYANGPVGTFVALSLTRAVEGSLLSRTHNMHVANIACNVAQAETENAIGAVLELNADGTGTAASLKLIEDKVNTALAIALLQRKSEGPRASGAKWQASRTDILNVPDAELTGTLDLRLNSTLEKLTTRVLVQTAG